MRPSKIVGLVQPWIQYADALEAELKVHLENLNSQDAKIDRLRSQIAAVGNWYDVENLKRIALLEADHE